MESSGNYTVVKAHYSKLITAVMNCIRSCWKYPLYIGGTLCVLLVVWYVIIDHWKYWPKAFPGSV